MKHGRVADQHKSHLLHFFMVGCPLTAAAVLSCSSSSGRWLQPHFAVRAFSIAIGGFVGLPSLIGVLPCGLLLGLPLVEKSL